MAKSKKSLVKAFLMAAGLATAAVAGVVPQPAQAYNTTTHIVHMNNAQIAAANARRAADRRALNDYISAPTQKHLDRVVSRGVISKDQAAYAADCQLDVNSAQSSTNNINSEMRENFKTCVADAQNYEIATANDVGSAAKLGLDKGLQPYFAQCQTEAGVTPGQGTTTAQAKSAIQCMKDGHWENDTKPALNLFGMIFGGGALAATAGSMVMNRRRRYS